MLELFQTFPHPQFLDFNGNHVGGLQLVLSLTNELHVKNHWLKPGLQQFHNIKTRVLHACNLLLLVTYVKYYIVILLKKTNKQKTIVRKRALLNEPGYFAEL